MEDCFCQGKKHVYRSKKPLVVVWCNQCSFEKGDKSVGAKVMSPVFGEGSIESWSFDAVVAKFKTGTYELDPREVQYVIDPKDYEKLIGKKR